MRALAVLLCLGGVARADVDVQKIAALTAKDQLAYKHAVSLADRVGRRFAGTPGAAKAVEWAVAEMKAAGLANVHTEPVTLTPWHRGADDRVELVAPERRTLHALALGGSVATPAEGVTAAVVAVDSFDALHKLGDAARGKIVFFDAPMKRMPTGEDYGRLHKVRTDGAVEAAKVGAVGAIVRSIGTGHHRLPHAGAMSYDEKIGKIPAAALAAEDADFLERALARGPVKLSLHLSCAYGDKVSSANVVGEVRGQKSGELVLLAAHLDSWDVGDGALDDAAGVGIVLEAAQLAAALHPKRTIRVVLFMNEENGLDGAKAYAVAHAAEVAKHFAALESDIGAGAPLGVASTTEPGAALLRRWGTSWSALGVGNVIVRPFLGADISPLREVPAFGVSQDASDYFEWHHTEGDTADKIDPAQIERAAAAFTVLAAQLALTGEALPRVPLAASH